MPVAKLESENIADIAGRLFRCVDAFRYKLAPEDTAVVLRAVRQLATAGGGNEHVRDYAHGMMDIVASEGTMQAAELDSALTLWETVLRNGDALTVTTQAWQALGALVRSTATYPAFLERLHAVADRWVRTARNNTDALAMIDAMHMCREVISSDAAHLDVLEGMADLLMHIVIKCGVPCRPVARNTLGMLVLRLVREEETFANDEQRTNLATRTFMSAVRLRGGLGGLGDRLCPGLIRVLGRMRPPVAEAAQALNRHGLGPELVAGIGDFAAAPGSAQLYKETLRSCSALAIEDRRLGRVIGAELWEAVCAPVPAIGLWAAEGFARLAQGGGTELWRAMDSAALARVAECLPPTSGTVTGETYAKKVFEVMTGTAAQLRHRPSTQRAEVQPGLWALCAAMAPQMMFMATVPSLDAARFAMTYTSICMGLRAVPGSA